MRFRRFEVVEGVKDEARVREEAAMKSQERAARGREQGGGVHGGLLLCVSVSVSGAVWSDLSFERVTVGNRLQGPGRVG